MSNLDVPSPYWQEPAGPDYGSSRRSGAGGGNGDRPVSRPAPRSGGPGGPDRRARSGGYDARPSGGTPRPDRAGRGDSYSGAAGRNGRPADPRSPAEPWADPRGRDARRPAGVPDSRDPRDARPAGGSAGRSGQRPPAGGRGYAPEPGQGGAAQDLRDRLGVRTGGDGRAPAGGRRAAGGGQDWLGDEGGGRGAGRGRGRRSGGGGRGSGPGGPGDGQGGPGGGGRRGFKQWLLSGSWWRRWTWKKALGVAAAFFVGIPVILLIAFFVAYVQTPLPTDTTAIANAQPSQVYFSNHHLLGSFSSSGVNRQVLQASQIPAVMNNAIIAAEDRHFYTEGGISPAGLLRAGFEDLKGGSAAQGGSTLTVQFVKNYYSGFASATNTDKAANDKFRQILVAIKLAHSKSKSWILTQYLNTVYFGHNSYGVGAAAQTYFGVPALKLNAAQSAMLAAMVQMPSYFDPDPKAGTAYDALYSRWQYVLKGMVIDKALTQAQASKLHFPKVHYHLSSSLNGYRGYLMQMVSQELTSTYHLSQAQLDSGGLKITTTFSQTLMNGLYKAVAQNKTLLREDGTPLPSYAYIGSVLEQPSTGAIRAIYGGPGYGVRNCEKLHCDLNMAENPKQVGSSFKPYVLATAVSQGMNVQTSVLNGFSPLWIPEGQSLEQRDQLSSRAQPTVQDQGYLPFNQPGENSGPLTVSKAAAISSDPAFEDLAHRDGVQNVINMTKAFGVGQTPFTLGGPNDWEAMNQQFGADSKKDTAGSVAIALGESDLTPIEQASTFATLINGGTYHAPHVIASIIQGSSQIPLKLQTHEVLTLAQAADVDYALSFDNVPGGTAYPGGAWPGRQVIGKTGTTETAQDAWFVGAIPQYAMSVALFTDSQNSQTGPGEQTLDILRALPGNATGGYGGAWPTAIWHTFMMNQFSGLAVDPLPTPDYTTFSKWDQVGLMARHHHHQPTPPTGQFPTPTPTLTCKGRHNKHCAPPGGGGFSPSPPVTPTPTPTLTPTPTPTPTCTSGSGPPCPQATPPN